MIHGGFAEWIMCVSLVIGQCRHLAHQGCTKAAGIHQSEMSVCRCSLLSASLHVCVDVSILAGRGADLGRL